jgi:hypothetical protein
MAGMNGARIRLMEDLPGVKPRVFRIVLECGHETRVSWARLDIVESFRDRREVHCWDCDSEEHRRARALAALKKAAEG